MTVGVTAPGPIDDWLGPSGRLQQAIEGFRVRTGQLSLAKAVDQAIRDKHNLVAEAGTGVGKTFAYLTPIILAGEKAIVSTASKTLQDQLFSRDIPRLIQAMGLPLQVARLKGRANYLCWYRLEKAKTEGRLASPLEVEQLRAIQQFAGVSSDGDIGGCESVPETASIWPLVTSTTDNCLGSSCPDYSRCHVVAARQKAHAADLVVVNHHLLCADLSLDHSYEAQLLPRVGVMVIDEAHAFADIATQFFGANLSTQTLAGFGRELLAAGLVHARDGADWAGLNGRLELCISTIRQAFAEQAHRPGAGSGAGPGSGSGHRGQGLGVDRFRWTDLGAKQLEQCQLALAELGETLQTILSSLTPNLGRHPEIDRLYDRVGLIKDSLRQCQPPSIAPGMPAGSLGGTLGDTPTGAADQDGVFWIERHRHGLSMHWAPLAVGDQLAPYFSSPSTAWIMVSATLATAGDNFDYFMQQTGIRAEQALTVESPFDYAQQGLLWVPEVLPDPKSPELMRQLLQNQDLRAVIRRCPGGIFMLCTSHRAVRQAKAVLEEEPEAFGNRLLLVQGDASRDALLNQFRQAGQAILVGSASFWEGVDVPGQALSMVLIDKLPFGTPDDPILESRIAACKAEQGDAFMNIQWPEATLALKQGVGRLIRTETDHGLLVIGDKRLAETGYGRRMLRSLPPFTRTRSAQQARDFFPDLQA
ncbi:MAG: ATP-dependent DNA helicase [Burkholderiaceae bacterium]